MMRLAIEVSDSEHAAFKALATSLPDAPGMSALVRALLRCALEGKIKPNDLRAALGGPRPVLNVTLTPGTSTAIDDNAPATREEEAGIDAYLRKHPNTKVYLAKWRRGFYK